MNEGRDGGDFARGDKLRDSEKLRGWSGSLMIDVGQHAVGGAKVNADGIARVWFHSVKKRKRTGLNRSVNADEA